MASPSSDAAEAAIPPSVLSQLSHRPRHIIEGMIKPTRTASFSRIQRLPHHTRDLGLLDTLPLELLHFTFSLLDIGTLCTLQQICRRGIDVVESLLEFCDLMRHAPKAMAALGATGLARVHSVNGMHSTLRTPDCVSCGTFGAFVFLPTFERCCYECLSRNQSLWVVTVSQAKRCFHLSASEARKLPILHSLPGTYWVKNRISRKQRRWLVSVRAAKQLVSTQSQLENIKQELQDRRSAGSVGVKEFYKHLWLLKAPLQPPGAEILTRPSGANVGDDENCGMASIELPWLRAGNKADKGLWCLGCQELSRTCDRLYDADGTDLERLYERMETTARAEDAFKDHAQQCEGAQRLMATMTE